MFMRVDGKFMVVFIGIIINTVFTIVTTSVDGKLFMVKFVFLKPVGSSLLESKKIFFLI